MDSSAETFELVNWKLDLVKSHFSADNKPNCQPVLDQEGSPDYPSIAKSSKSILYSVENKIKRICKFASRFCSFNLDLQGFLGIFKE